MMTAHEPDAGAASGRMPRFLQRFVSARLLVACGAVGLAAWLALGGSDERDTGMAGVDASTIVRGWRLDELVRTHRETSFSLLSSFVYSRDDMQPAFLGEAARSGRARIPDDIAALHGQNVAIDGFMLPLDYDGTGVGLFILNADRDLCSFEAPTVLTEFVIVRMTRDRRTAFTHAPIRVFGRFEVGEERRDGKVSLYRIAAEAVGPPGAQTQR